MATLKVRNFGPIGAADIGLDHPLTILIGPNNAGKSYLAIVRYALATHRMLGPRHRPLAWRYVELPRIKLDKKAREFFRSKRGPSVRISEIPEPAQDAIRSQAPTILQALGDSFAAEIRRCFAVKELADLSREGAAAPLEIEVFRESPLLHLPIGGGRGEIDYSEAPIPLDRLPAALLSEAIPQRLLGYAASVVSGPAFYLPAARSGILQGHRALASSVISMIPMVGIEPVNLPMLSGVVADFIAQLLQLNPRGVAGPVANVAEFLESSACGGRFELRARGEGGPYPEIYYAAGRARLAMHRTSSMVSELAPIILFLKYLVRPGDSLIIEEPEAHLHPDTQLTLARAIGKLIRAGVKLTVTTHSDYLVQQLSNLVGRDGRPISKSQADDERLDPKEVGVYLVAPGADGSNATRLAVTAEEGIPQDEFGRIAEALYDETTRINRARLSTDSA